MSSVTEQMQALSVRLFLSHGRATTDVVQLDEAGARPTIQQGDNTSEGGVEPRTQAKSPHQPVSRRPRLVSPHPLPPRDECLEARRRGKCMYFGFYAGASGLQRALISCFPKELTDRDPYSLAILWPAVLYLREITGRYDLDLHVGIVSQRLKDLIPSIEEDVGAHVLILGLFPLEVDAYERRITQEGADKLSQVLGTPPTWWRISQLLS